MNLNQILRLSLYFFFILLVGKSSKVAMGWQESKLIKESNDVKFEYENLQGTHYAGTPTELQLGDGTEDPLGKGGCEDKIPNCSNYVSQCCTMKQAMNVSCQKTCKFCTDSPPVPPAAGVGVPAPTPTASSNQDPCDPTNPPSATVNVPGQTTTTTLAPVGTLPPVG